MKKIVLGLLLATAALPASAGSISFSFGFGPQVYYDEYAPAPYHYAPVYPSRHYVPPVVAYPRPVYRPQWHEVRQNYRYDHSQDHRQGRDDPRGNWRGHRDDRRDYDDGRRNERNDHDRRR